MLKRIEINLEPLEILLYYWSAVADREKVAESFFTDVANMDSVKAVLDDQFDAESIRKVLSAIQNREKLSGATKPELKFWNNNMWMMEDLEMPQMMSAPIKKMNLNTYVEELNQEFPNFDREEITVYFAPLHLETYYITNDMLIINFFRIMVDLFGDNPPKIDGVPVEEFVIARIKEYMGR
ncbi:MAG: hypothetical protein Q4G61_11010 [Tissierellia bacterium]|nr:hypothetical protein [Tissierellia bacterium]